MPTPRLLPLAGLLAIAAALLLAPALQAQSRNHDRSSGTPPWANGHNHDRSQLPPGLAKPHGHPAAPLVAALTSRGNAGAAIQARALADAVAAPLETPAQVQAATVAYNAFVDASSAAFLKAPAEEFLELRSELQALGGITVAGQ